MMIQEFILDDNDNLIFEEHYSCCYCGVSGAEFKNGTLYISDKVRTIKCKFNGIIEQYFHKEGKPIHNVLRYTKIVASNKQLNIEKFLIDKSIKVIYCSKQ